MVEKTSAFDQVKARSGEANVRATQLTRNKDDWKHQGEKVKARKTSDLWKTIIQPHLTAMSIISGFTRLIRSWLDPKHGVSSTSSGSLTLSSTGKTSGQVCWPDDVLASIYPDFRNWKPLGCWCFSKNHISQCFPSWNELLETQRNECNMLLLHPKNSTYNEYNNITSI